MCDWCELVFTSEEKLDMHIDSDHQEAMDGDVYKEIGDLEEQLVLIFFVKIILFFLNV